MLVAPVVAGQSNQKIYLPEGDWYEFSSSKKYAGKSSYTIDVPLEQVPVFLKSGSILPLANVTQHTDDPESWQLTALVFGENQQPATLYEDDGTVNPELKEVKLTWDNRKLKGSLERTGKAGELQYSVVDWKFIS